MRAACVLALLCLSSAVALKGRQPEDPGVPDAPSDEPVEGEGEGAGEGEMEMSDEMVMMFGEQYIAFQVAQEAQMSRKVLDLMVNLQTAYYQSTGAQMFINKMFMEYQQQNGAVSYLEIDSAEDFEDDTAEAEPAADLEEDDDDVVEIDATSDDDAPAPQLNLEEKRGLNKKGIAEKQLHLLGNLNLFHAHKLWTVGCMYKAHDLNEQFWGERATQLKISLFGDQVPPEILQVFYMQLASTFLKSNSLSLALQTISTMSTLFEDEIDYGTFVLTNPNLIKKGDSMFAEDITDDALWAFTAFEKFASMEMTIFVLDYYIQYQFNQLMGPQMGDEMGKARNMMQAQRMMGKQSFLETETVTGTETKTKTKFYAALLAPFVIGGSHQSYLDLYTFYQVYMQHQAASSGLMSAYATKQSITGKQNQKMLMQQAKHLAHSFATSLQQVANVGYITNLWKLYFLFQGSYEQEPPMGGQAMGGQAMGGQAMGGQAGAKAMMNMFRR